MRDRTRELKKDEECSDNDDGAVRLVIREKEDPTGAFFQQVSQIRDGTHKLRELVNAMENLQLRILSTPILDEGHKDELQSLRDQIKTAASRIQHQLKGIEPRKGDEESDQYSVDSRIRRTQYGTLSRDYVEVMTLCNTLQSQYRERNMERLQRQLKITGVRITEEKIEEMLESGKNHVFTANLMQDTQVTQQALNEIENRHTELLRLERSISELHELFLLLAMEVESQGEMVDNIESNISKSVNYVGKAADNTAAAVVSQRKARKKKLCLVVCVSVLLLIIIAVIVSVTVPS